MTRWLVLALLFIARLPIGLQFQSVSSAGQGLVDELGLSMPELGALIGLYVLPGIAVALPGGVLTARLDNRLLAIAALAFMAVGSVVLGIASDYATLLAGRLMGGLGFAILTVVLAKMTADWFVGRELTTAMGVLLASYPCGVALGLWMQPRLVEASGWRVAMHATAGLCLVAMLLVAMCWRLLRRPGALVPVRARRGALTRGEMFASVMSGVAWGGLNVAMLVFFSFAPRLFEATGMTTIGASGYVGAAMWVSALAVPLGGILAERIPAPLTTAIAICGCTAAALALLPTGVAPTLLLMFVGVGIGAPAAIIIALPGNVLRARARGLGFGIFYGVFFVEAAFGPLVAGWIEAWTSSIGLAIEFGALALVTSVVALAALAIPTSDRVPGVQRAMEITGQTGGDGARGP